MFHKLKPYFRVDLFLLIVKRRYLFLLLSFFLYSCSSQNKKYVFSGTSMGMHYNVTLYAYGGDKEIFFRNFIDKTFNRMGQVLSHFIQNSEVSRFNRLSSGVRFKISEDLMRVLERSKEISKVTDGRFDITVGPLVDLWGFGVNGFPNKLPKQKEVEKILKKVGYKKLILHRKTSEIEKKLSGLQVNVSAIGKGYMIDSLGEGFEKMGVKSYLIEMGGEIRAKRSFRDKKPWQVGVEVPAQRVTRGILELIPIYNGAIATSGSYRNYYIKEGSVYSHTIDTKTGYPVKQGPISVTVVDNECWKADALATVLMSMPLEIAKRWAEVQSIAALILQVKSNGELSHYRTKAFQSRVSKE